MPIIRELIDAQELLNEVMEELNIQYMPIGQAELMDIAELLVTKTVNKIC